MAAGCVIGVDLGGTKLLAGVVDEGLQVRHRAYRLGRGGTTQEVLDDLYDVIGEVLDAPGRRRRAAIGLGVPCLVDRARGVALSSNHLPLEDVPIRDLVAERFDLPVEVDNDGNAALLAEWRWGAARRARDAVLLTLGTGIGGGVLAGGALVRGHVGAAAELGHMVIDADGPPCQGSCPNRGCLEAYVSGAALGREGLRVPTSSPTPRSRRVLASGAEITGALVTEVAHDGDEAARDGARRDGPAPRRRDRELREHLQPRGRRGRRRRDRGRRAAARPGARGRHAPARCPTASRGADRRRALRRGVGDARRGGAGVRRLARREAGRRWPAAAGSSSARRRSATSRT